MYFLCIAGILGFCNFVVFLNMLIFQSHTLCFHNSGKIISHSWMKTLLAEPR